MDVREELQKIRLEQADGHIAVIGWQVWHRRLPWFYEDFRQIDLAGVDRGRMRQLYRILFMRRDAQLAERAAARRVGPRYEDHTISLTCDVRFKPIVTVFC